MSGCDIRLSSKNILTMKQVSQDSQDWSRGGGSMEEGLLGRRSVEVICGGRYGGKV